MFEHGLNRGVEYLPSGAAVICYRGRPAWLVVEGEYLATEQLDDYFVASGSISSLPDYRGPITEFREWMKGRNG